MFGSNIHFSSVTRDDRILWLLMAGYLHILFNYKILIQSWYLWSTVWILIRWAVFSEQEQFLLLPPAQDTKQPVYQRNQPNIVKPELPPHIKYPLLLCITDTGHSKIGWIIISWSRRLLERVASVSESDFMLSCETGQDKIIQEACYLKPDCSDDRDWSSYNMRSNKVKRCDCSWLVV